MPKGTVKWFNPTKGYGFIQPQGGGKDVFVHISAVELAGLSNLNEGQAIEYEEVSNPGRMAVKFLPPKHRRYCSSRVGHLEPRAWTARGFLLWRQMIRRII